MTQQEVLEYNKRCAEFLGYINLTPDDKDFDFYEKLEGVLGKMLEPKSMKFHSDWNWIMEVVEAIEKVNFTQVPEFSCFTVVIKDKRCIIKQHSQFALAFEKLSDSFHNSNSPFVIRDSKKEAVVQAINQFLIWYNENSKNTLV